MARSSRWALAASTVVCVVGALLFFSGAHTVSAQTSQTAAYIQSTDGGMATYGTAMQGSSSSSATLQTLSNWNGYVASRSNWSLTSPLVTRLANADWTRRQNGLQTITPQELADAANRLIAAQLATLSASQQQQLWNTMTMEQTPKGNFGIGSSVSNVSAVRNSDGTWRVTVAPEMFSRRKAFFAQYAPGMVSTGTNFYPGEAVLIFYSVGSGDMGYGSQWVAKVRKAIGDLTGLDMTSRQLFGDNGYVARRPMNTFLTEPRMSQFFTDLGF